MKDFFLKYGFLALIGVCIVIFIIMITPAGEAIRDAAITLYGNITNSDVAGLLKSNEEIVVERNDNIFTITIDSAEKDEWEVKYKYRDTSGLWSDWEEINEKMSVGERPHVGQAFIQRVEPGCSLEFQATKTNAIKPYTIETGVIDY